SVSLRLVRGGAEAPVERTGRRRRACGGSRHRGRDLGERTKLLACLLGRCEKLLRAGAVALVEGIERIAGDQLVSLGVHDPSDSASSSSSRRRARPANILLLIVPSGTPSLSARSGSQYPA